MKRGLVTAVHPCDRSVQVVTVVRREPDRHAVRREPCDECPWRKDQPVGAFPVEAYRHSAKTSVNMADSTFACHMAGVDKPQTCAGFMLSSGAAHNLVLRLASAGGRLGADEASSSVPLYSSYREMAEANGVAPDDPALEGCR